jgi:hypothetical protein
MVDYAGAIWLPNNNYFANTGKKSFVILHGTAGGSSAQEIANYFKSTEGSNNPVSSNKIEALDLEPQETKSISLHQSNREEAYLFYAGCKSGKLSQYCQCSWFHPSREGRYDRRAKPFYRFLAFYGSSSTYGVGALADLGVEQQYRNPQRLSLALYASGNLHALSFCHVQFANMLSSIRAFCLYFFYHTLSLSNEEPLNSSYDTPSSRSRNVPYLHSNVGFVFLLPCLYCFLYTSSDRILAYLHYQRSIAFVCLEYYPYFSGDILYSFCLFLPCFPDSISCSFQQERLYWLRYTLGSFYLSSLCCFCSAASCTLSCILCRALVTHLYGFYLCKRTQQWHHTLAHTGLYIVCGGYLEEYCY